MATILGPLLAVGGFAAYYRRVPWPFLAIIAAGALIGLFGLIHRPGLATGASAAVAVGVLGLACWYLLSYSMFGVREDRPRVGDFTLPSSTGEDFSLHASRGQRRLLILYRGDWCPFCQTELRDLRNHYGGIRARGVRVIAVSVDPPELSAQLRRTLGVDIDFVSDESGTLMDVLNVRDRNGLPAAFAGGRASRDIFLPTTFLLDEEDRIRWVYRPDTYRVRAPAEEVLQKIDQMNVVGKPSSRPPDQQGTAIDVELASGETGT